MIKHNTNYLNYHLLNHYTASIITILSNEDLTFNHHKNYHQSQKFDFGILLLCYEDLYLYSSFENILDHEFLY